jgi:putative transposase
VGRFTAFRFTVDASAQQAAVLARHAGASRFAFNQCLSMVKDALAARVADCSLVVPWSGFDLINAFNGWKRSAAAGRVLVVDAAGTVEVVTTGLPWRSEVCQQVFEEAAVDLGRGLAAYTGSRTGKRKGRRVGFPRFKRKGRGAASFRIRQRTTRGRTAIRVGEGGARSVTLPRIGMLRVREDTRRLRRMLANGRASILSATLSCRAGRWQVSLAVEAADLHAAHLHLPDDRAAAAWVGVDRGLAAFVVAATAADREVLRVEDPPRPLRAAQARLRRLSRQVSRKQKGSANRGKAVARLGRCHARVRNVREHFLHEVANRLVKTHDRLALEDLNVTGMMANHRLAQAIGDAAWARFARLVEYKQQWRGGQLVAVDRWYPSTRTCSRCRTLALPLPLPQRAFRCAACGYQADRDHNAAINLAIWAEEHAQVRDLEARGPVTNAYRGDGPDPHHRAGKTRPNDVGTPPHAGVTMGTPEKGAVT